jgi:hypothetical protein
MQSKWHLWALLVCAMLPSGMHVRRLVAGCRLHAGAGSTLE